jgi:DNA end-binding protein Ku
MPRATWKGSIAFGLVNIPVGLFTATRDKGVHFHLVAPDGSCRLRRQLVCPETGRTYDFDQTARGIEIAPDQYVILEQEEIERLRPDAGQTIEIEDFVDLASIDPIYFEKSYWLAPREGGARPYRLLVEALEQAQKVGIARFVLRTKAHLAAVRVADGALALSTMHWADEVEPRANVVPEVEGPVDARQLALAVNLIETLTRPFEPERYVDTHRQELLALIERKAAGGTVPMREEAEAPEPGEVVDLMDALKRSLEQTSPTEGEGTKRGRKTG